MDLQIKITFKQGPKMIAEIIGVRNVPGGFLTVEEVSEKVIETEQFLEKLLGLRAHIEIL